MSYQATLTQTTGILKGAPRFGWCIGTQKNKRNPAELPDGSNDAPGVSGNVHDAHVAPQVHAGDVRDQHLVPKDPRWVDGLKLSKATRWKLVAAN